MERCTVRPLTENDFDACMQLYRYLHTRDDPSPPSGTLNDLWRQLIGDPLTIYLGAFIDNRMVAVCNAQIVLNLTRGARPFAVVENVVTHPDYRRRGIGSALFTELIRRCDVHHCYKIMLLSGSSRTEAHAFYRAIGFDQSAKEAFVLSRRNQK